MNNEAKQMTETEATDEALRMFIRKIRRMAPEQFAEVWARLPEGARYHLNQAEMRADDRFLKGTVDIKSYPMPDFDADTDE